LGEGSKGQNYAKKNTIKTNPNLPENIKPHTTKLQVYTDLFRVYETGDYKIWCTKGALARYKTRLQVPSFPPWGI